MKRNTVSELEFSSPVKDVTRSIQGLTRLVLWVRAGGRCEFDGCNEYLIEHPVTLAVGSFGEAAHVVAFKPKGPRGRDGVRPRDINRIDNLMLVCPRCHKLIDDNPREYTRQTLEQQKTAHEERIRHLTSFGPDRKTATLIVKAPIRGDTVAVSFHQIAEATTPLYPLSREGYVIDLTAIEDGGTGFLQAAMETIKGRVQRFLDHGGEARKAQHISVFALGPIPLLVFLGRQLTNKIPCAVFQRHRDTESWTWKASGTPVRYAFRQIKSGSTKNVGLVVSLSGTIRPEELLDGAENVGSLYEITLEGTVPSPTCLSLKADVDGFRLVYQEAIATIMKNHGILETIDLFPAVPAPVAVLCGRELLPKVHPGLRVFDFDRERNGFTFQLEVK